MNMFDFQDPPTMRKGRVYDRHGNLIADHDGPLQDGEEIRLGVMFMDSQPSAQAIQDNGRQEYLDRLTNAWRDDSPQAGAPTVVDSRPQPSPSPWKHGLTNDELSDMDDEQRWTDYFNGKRDAEDAANREGDHGYHAMCDRIENAWRA